MPGQHRHGQHSVRIATDIWDAALDRATKEGYRGLNEVIAGLVEAYADGRIDAIPGGYRHAHAVPRVCREHFDYDRGESQPDAECPACRASAEYRRAVEARYAASVAAAQAENPTPEVLAWRKQFAAKVVEELRAAPRSGATGR